MVLLMLLFGSEARTVEGEDMASNREVRKLDSKVGQVMYHDG